MLEHCCRSGDPNGIGLRFIGVCFVLIKTIVNELSPLSPILNPGNRDTVVSITYEKWEIKIPQIAPIRVFQKNGAGEPARGISNNMVPYTVSYSAIVPSTLRKDGTVSYFSIQMILRLRFSRIHHA
jgi:hypothetical protein